MKELLLKLNVIYIILNNNYLLYLGGYHEKTGQKIAAKIIKISTLKTKELVDKIKREIEFSKFFRHPNIIHLYEVIETKTEIILIMEYASGGELFDLLCQEIVI